jgi:hypothetical protein
MSGIRTRRSGRASAATEWLRRQVDESLHDPRPNIPAHEVFKKLRDHHARQKRRERY